MSIVDVDFRFIEREEAIWDKTTARGHMGTVKVLQWRKKVQTQHEQKWTEWQDVRTEEE